jgi:RecA-family ATPase
VVRAVTGNGQTPNDKPPETWIKSAALSTVPEESVQWLWRGWLPRGKLVVLDGDPGTGKSTLSLDLAARISTGKPWPDGTAGTDPAPVVLATAEDDLSDTVLPRLRVAGGDPSYVYALIGLGYTGADGREHRRPFTLADVEKIEAVVRRLGAALVIIDVLAAYLPSGSDAHVDQDVRTVLAPVAEMAQRTRSCVLLLRHLNKTVGGSALYRGGGSIGISGAARGVLLAGRDPEDDKRRVLAQ